MAKHLDTGARPLSPPEICGVASQLLDHAASADDPAGFLKGALPLVREGVALDYVAVVRAEKGRWQTLQAAGPARTPPPDLLATALDGDRAAESGDWLAVPLDQEAAPGDVLVAAGAAGRWPQRRGELQPIASWIAAGLKLVRARQRDRQQIARLSAILEIAGEWTRTLEMDKLLARMAEASTKLLRAERASIFLWDKPSRTLVGRPALGVEGGELRIPDNTGIVGQVVQTGQPRRVDADVAAEQREIDRRTDQKLKFQTRSLVCVPLVSRRGELFGAFEVLNKVGGNFDAADERALGELAGHAAIALENTQEWEQLASARRQIADQGEQRAQLIGECAAVQALRSAIERVAVTDLAVLVLGENGTGKEVVAQMVHYRSRRRQEPLLAVNCAAIPDTLLESELFGHEKGAFTDAREMRRGKFELAASGTLFLDEIGDLSLAGQAKLLRVLEEKVIVRVGGSTPIATQARIIAATNQNLAELVRAKRFREDLFFRLNVVSLELPPLRERGEDVLLLAEHFLKRYAALARRRAPAFTAAARKRLLAHVWPGNVRELRNLMERLAYLAPEQQTKIDAPDLAFLMSPAAGPAAAMSLDHTLAEATRQFQVEYIRKQVDRLRGNMTAVAEQLGLHRSNLYRKLRQLGVDADETK